MKQNTEVLELNTVKESIVKHCSFSLGKQVIQDLLPSYNSLYIQRELKRAKEAYDVVIRFGDIPFYGIRDIRKTLMVALKDGICQNQDLLSIAMHARTCLQLQEFLKSTQLEIKELHDLASSLDYSISLSQEIERCFSPSGELLDSASSTLKSLRKSLRDTESQLSTTANKFIHSNSNKLMDTITTIRNDRVVVLMKMSDKNSVGGMIHGESSSGQTAFVEPECLVHLNNQRQIVISKIEEEIERILFELSQSVKEKAEVYLSNLETLALLDSYHAKALWAKEYNGVIATITEDKTIYLKDARHPLIDQKKVVANTYALSTDHSMLLITGPNTGGKTVSLKIIGLSVLMTYCGMAIAAEEATIPLFDQVFVDIGDDQSILNSLSTFSAHLSKLAVICEEATMDSLILLDELGGGTDPKEGESLAIAILDYLRKIKATTIATTHYGALKTHGKSHSDILLSSVQFDIEKMQPTYKYIQGLSGQSNAFEIAQRFGLKGSIIEHAQALKEMQKTEEEKLMERLEKEMILTQQLHEQLDEKLQLAKEKEESLQQKEQALADQKEAILLKAEEEAKSYLESMEDEVEAILLQMKETQQTGKYHEAIALKKKMETLLDIEETEDELYTIQVKDYVSIKGTNQRGYVESVDKNKVICNVNGMKMTVKLTDVKPATPPVMKKEKSTHKANVPTSISLELNLLGLRVDEAMPLLDKYIDDLVLMRATTARIIHGNGTGALRAAVTQFVKQHKLVEEYRLGGMGEGGLGVTVITLGKKK